MFSRLTRALYRAFPENPNGPPLNPELPSTASQEFPRMHRISDYSMHLYYHPLTAPLIRDLGVKSRYDTEALMTSTIPFGKLVPCLTQGGQALSSIVTAPDQIMYGTLIGPCWIVKMQLVNLSYFKAEMQPSYMLRSLLERILNILRDGTAKGILLGFEPGERLII